MSFEKPWGNYLLENIVETTSPETISYFPETIGWKVLLVLMVGLTIKKLWHTWKTYQNNAYRREALAWLDHVDVGNEKQVRQLPALLKKTASLAYKVTDKTGDKNTHNGTDKGTHKSTSINQLSGEDWVKWLDQYCVNTHFNQKQYSALLTNLPYQKSIAVDDQQLANLIEQITLWIKYHQVTETSL